MSLLAVVYCSLVTLQVCDMIELEKSELVMIRDQCSDDIDSIGEWIDCVYARGVLVAWKMH